MGDSGAKRSIRPAIRTGYFDERRGVSRQRDCTTGAVYTDATGSGHGAAAGLDAASILRKVVQNQITGLTGIWPPFALKAGVTTAFSLDGFHPNNRGYMEVANLFLDSINHAMGKSYAHYTP